MIDCSISKPIETLEEEESYEPLMIGIIGTPIKISLLDLLMGNVKVSIMEAEAKTKAKAIDILEEMKVQRYSEAIRNGYNIRFYDII